MGSRSSFDLSLPFASQTHHDRFFPLGLRLGCAHFDLQRDPDLFAVVGRRHLAWRRASSFLGRLGRLSHLYRPYLPYLLYRPFHPFRPGLGPILAHHDYLFRSIGLHAHELCNREMMNRNPLPFHAETAFDFDAQVTLSAVVLHHGTHRGLGLGLGLGPDDHLGKPCGRSDPLHHGLQTGNGAYVVVS